MSISHTKNSSNAAVGTNFFGSVSVQQNVPQKESGIGCLESEESRPWVRINSPRSGFAVPTGAVEACRNVDRRSQYVARIEVDNEVVPALASFIDGKFIALADHKGNFFQRESFELLLNRKVSWIPASDGYVPPNAIKVGESFSRENIYMGRTRHNKDLTQFYKGSDTVHEENVFDGPIVAGMIQPSERCIKIAFGFGRPIYRYKYYEVMVSTEPHLGEDSLIPDDNPIRRTPFLQELVNYGPAIAVLVVFLIFSYLTSLKPN